MGRRDYIESADLMSTVEASYFDVLFEMNAFQRLFKASEDYRQVQASTEQADVELEELETALKSQINEAEYIARMKAIQEKLKKEIQAAAHAWYKLKSGHVSTVHV